MTPPASHRRSSTDGAPTIGWILPPVGINCQQNRRNLLRRLTTQVTAAIHSKKSCPNQCSRASSNRSLGVPLPRSCSGSRGMELPARRAQGPRARQLVPNGLGSPLHLLPLLPRQELSVFHLPHRSDVQGLHRSGGRVKATSSIRNRRSL